jgi:hypothetical protein
MEKFRTEAQFLEIAEDANNGNFQDAAKLAEKYGFYASDLIRHQENTNALSDALDVAYIAEMAQELR